MAKSVKSRVFGKIKGKNLKIYTLENSNGLVFEFTEYGGRLVKAIVPDRNGNMGDVVLGYDTLADYLKDDTYQGALVGRYGNRICDGKFTLDGVEYNLDKNNAPGGIPCALHGGKTGLKGFSLRVWKSKPVETEHAVGVEFTISSPDGGEGYPGKVDVQVTVLLTDDNALRYMYKATTTKNTHMALTTHPYWNLDGAFNGSNVFDHRLMINAEKFTPYNAGMIPTGELRDVRGTPFDFTNSHKIGNQVKCRDYDQIEFGNGYDMNWVLNGRKGEALSLAAVLESDATGRRMEVWTTEPGIQVYDGSYLPDGDAGKDGGKFSPNCGVALETQHFPDSPNKPMFPSTLLKPGQILYSTTEYRFKA